MKKDELLELLSGLPLTNVQNYGLIVSITEVYDACEARGLDVDHLVVAWLQALEKDKLISLVRMKDPGFEELVIGFTFPESA
ncbi:hypothetical protein [Paenibacillus sp. FSL R5-808]|uniref:hypothetical protein n=1 Tax=unclassified Paenibacillus TaxID=185978 RepID=UPI0003E211CA|nr:hypothetical protein [Paenibacillus sp. FSL R5-808]ETT32144.1 hypothetical protein C169_24080 [Paenibacillus sp. FSL R5-808]